MEDGPIRANDAFLGEKVGLQTLGVVDLDTSIMTDVFGLCVFDRSKPVIRVLPGDFSNTIRILVPDVAATPVAFQDILIEDIKSMPHQVNGISEFDLTEETLVVLAVCGHASSSMETVPVRRNVMVSGVVVEP